MMMVMPVMEVLPAHLPFRLASEPREVNLFRPGTQPPNSDLTRR